MPRSTHWWPSATQRRNPAISRAPIRFAQASRSKESFSKIPRKESVGSVNKTMKIESRLVQCGARKKAGNFVPVTTPIYTAASYFYESMGQLDRVMGREEEGPSYARYDNPTNGALEELVNELEGGEGTVACASGMSAV